MDANGNYSIASGERTQFMIHNVCTLTCKLHSEEILDKWRTGWTQDPSQRRLIHMCRSRGLLDVTTASFHDTDDVYTGLAAVNHVV